MSNRFRLLWLVGGVPVSALAIVASAAPQPLAAVSSKSHFEFNDPMLAHAWRLAMGNALLRLRKPACYGLLNELQDDRGVSLAEVLDEESMSIGEHAASLTYRESPRGALFCVEESAAAYTTPRGRAIVVCPIFKEEVRRDLMWGDFVVIHELLHTLGLGERRGGSRLITAHVAERCQ